MPQISHKYHKDFCNPDYRNIRLHKDKEKQRRKTGRLFGFFALIFAICLFYFLFFSPLFTIGKIQINGLEKIRAENIDSIVNDYLNGREMLIFRHNNFWIFNKEELKTKIFERYYFDDFKIRKRLLNKITIDLKEKQAVINWLTNNFCFHLDPSALAIEYCEKNDGFIVIRDLQNNELKVGEYAVPSAELKNLVELFNSVKAIVADKVKITNMEKNAEMMDINTEEGIQFKFNMKFPVQEQLSRLSVLVFQENIKNNLNKMQYIDLRFGEKVYYK
ncbi:hypothetical protein HZB94_02405 [Candidatus Falkowbacteria bacterium]|nr:hypothetical protein [Candidatus Falkowbacteria bacterium]